MPTADRTRYEMLIEVISNRQRRDWVATQRHKVMYKDAANVD